MSPHPVLASILLLVGCNVDIYRVDPVKGRLVGRVVDMDGDPLGGARVLVLDGGSWDELAHSDAGGAFETRRIEGNRWLRVEADGYFPRARPCAPGEEATFRLSEDDGSTVRLVFAGSTSFGERYYEQGLLEPGFEAVDLPGVLGQVEPLFDGVQLVNVALEGPLTVAELEHPDQGTIYRSHPLVGPGLARAGVDVAHLATDHAYDLLDQGLDETFDQLDDAGVIRQGAGFDEAEAWEPALLDVGPVRIGLLGCTTITAADGAMGLVADDEQGHGGPASCGWTRLDEAVQGTREQVDLLVLQLHGGDSFEPRPSQAVSTLAERAIEGGADIVINHHPRVNGGLSWSAGGLVLESLGVLASDLGLWETLPSTLVELQVQRDGTVSRVYAEPLLRDGLQPTAVLGWPRQRIARDVLSLSSAEVALDDGALELDLGGRARLEERSLDVIHEGDGWSAPVDLRDGWLTGFAGAGAWQLGVDLLRVGDFEDIDADERVAEGALWVLDSDYEWLSDQAAHSGAYGLRLARDTSHTQAVWTHPAHRIPFDPEQPLTLSGWLRGEGPVELQLSWYDASSGSSFAQSFHVLDSERDWAPFVIELAPPEGAAWVGLYIKLPPPERDAIHADLDALRLVSWARGEPEDTSGYDMLRVSSTGSATLRRRVMPVAE